VNSYALDDALRLPGITDEAVARLIDRRLVKREEHPGGTRWQRVHFRRNLLATVPKGAREAIAAVVRTIFAQPDRATAMTQLRKVPDGLRARFSKQRWDAESRPQSNLNLEKY
jgi:hypothetical protein